MRQQDEGKQGILELLNLEDSGPICAFAIERSRGVFSVSASVPEPFSLHSMPGQDAAAQSEDVHCDEPLRLVAITFASSPTTVPGEQRFTNLPE